MSFTELTLRNFRAWEQLILPIRPITLLFGPNNSGKSSILSALPLLAQTIESADREVPLLLSDKYVDLGTYGDVVFNNDRRRAISIGFSLDTDRGNRTNVFRLQDYFPIRSETQFRFRSQRRQIVLASSQTYDTLNSQERMLLSTKYSDSEDVQVISTAIQSVDSPRVRRVGRRALTANHFLPALGGAFRRQLDIRAPEDEERLRAAGHIDRVQTLLSSALRSMEYLGPLRRGPSRTYLFSGQNPNSVGGSGEWATDILVSDYLRRGKEKTGILESVSKWTSVAGVASSVRVNPLSDRHFEIRVEHPVTGESENIADVGSGVSQILPVLVAGYWADPGETLTLEHPEIHLHPKAQAELGQFFLELYSRHVQVIAETHSEHLLLRLQRLVAEGRICSEDVAIYYVYAEEGRKIVRRLALSKQGQFTDEWPQGYFPERLEELRAILKGPARRKAERQ